MGLLTMRNRLGVKEWLRQPISWNSGRIFELLKYNTENSLKQVALLYYAIQSANTYAKIGSFDFSAVANPT